MRFTVGGNKILCRYETYLYTKLFWIFPSGPRLKREIPEVAMFPSALLPVAVLKNMQTCLMPSKALSTRKAE